MAFLLKKRDLDEFLSKIKKGHVLIAPVKKKNIHVFEEINDIGKIDLDFINTRYPLKYYFIPKKEDIIQFNGQKIKPIYDNKKVAIFGIRPCDVNALLINDMLFKTDTYYMKRRENTTIIALMCNKAGENCFCQYDGFDKLDNGYDLKLYEQVNNYLVEVGSKIGKKLIKGLKTTNKKPKNMLKCDLNIIISQIKKLRDNFRNDIWEKEAKRCLSCTACTTSCPTCLCFDIEDEINLNLKSGKRQRKYASCQLCDFTRVAGNFIFRKERGKRLKHRLYHKWQYFPEQFGKFMCTGCGRCITNCPTKLSMIKMVDIL